MRVSLAMLLSLAVLSGCCSKGAKGGLGTGQEEGVIPTGKEVSPLVDVNFGFDSSKLDSKAKELLGRHADWMKTNASKKVIVQGHCDERGTTEYNMALGERRARSAFDFLRSLGAKADQMSTISYGKELPRDPGHNEAAWAKNRRAQFEVK